MTVSTDHRLVICKLNVQFFVKADKTHNKESRTGKDQQVEELSCKQKELLAKIKPSTNRNNILQWKIERNRVMNEIKKRLATIREETEVAAANELNAQNSAHAYHQVLKKFVTSKPTQNTTMLKTSRFLQKPIF